MNKKTFYVYTTASVTLTAFSCVLQGSNNYQVEFTAPAEGWTAFFVTVRYTRGSPLRDQGNSIKIFSKYHHEVNADKQQNVQNSQTRNKESKIIT